MSVCLHYTKFYIANDTGPRRYSGHSKYGGLGRQLQHWPDLYTHTCRIHHEQHTRCLTPSSNVSLRRRRHILGKHLGMERANPMVRGPLPRGTDEFHRWWRFTVSRLHSPEQHHFYDDDSPSEFPTLHRPCHPAIPPPRPLRRPRFSVIHSTTSRLLV